MELGFSLISIDNKAWYFWIVHLSVPAMSLLCQILKHTVNPQVIDLATPGLDNKQDESWCRKVEKEKNEEVNIKWQHNMHTVSP